MFGWGDRVVSFDLVEKAYIHLLAVSFPCCVHSEQVTNLKWETWNLIPSLAKWAKPCSLILKDSAMNSEKNMF